MADSNSDSDDAHMDETPAEIIDRLQRDNAKLQGDLNTLETDNQGLTIRLRLATELNEQLGEEVERLNEELATSQATQANVSRLKAVLKRLRRRETLQHTTVCF